MGFTSLQVFICLKVQKNLTYDITLQFMRGQEISIRTVFVSIIVTWIKVSKLSGL